jgi:hypothetical protein
MRFSNLKIIFYIVGLINFLLNRNPSDIFLSHHSHPIKSDEVIAMQM